MNSDNDDAGADISADYGFMQIFLRAGQMAELDKIRTELLNRSAITLQRHARGFVKRSQYQRKRYAIVVLQACSCSLYASLASSCGNIRAHCIGPHTCSQPRLISMVALAVLHLT